MGLLLRSTVPALILGGALGLVAFAADPVPPGPAPTTAPLAAASTGPPPATSKDGFDLLSVPGLPESWNAPPRAPVPLVPPLPVFSNTSRPIARVAVPSEALPAPTPSPGWTGRLTLPPIPLLGQQAVAAPPKPPALWPTSQGCQYRPFSARVQEAPRVTSGVVFLEEDEPARMQAPTLGYGAWGARPTPVRDEPARATAPAPGQPEQLKWSVDQAEGKTPARAAHPEAPRPFRPAPLDPPPIVPPPQGRAGPVKALSSQKAATPRSPWGIDSQPPAAPVSVKQLKKQVSETAGRLARSVEVRPGPEGTIIVHVVTSSATTANYLAERILQLPEMSAPTIRLDMKVDQ